MSIQNGIGQWLLKRKIKNLKRKKKLRNWENIRKVGLIYLVENELQVNTVKKFLGRIKEDNKEITAIGFVDDKSIPAFALHANTGFLFNQKDLSWFQLPKNDYLKKFILEEFDLLIDLSNSYKLPLAYLASLSQAKFKAGLNLHQSAHSHDLSIELPGKSNESEFHAELLKYLKILKVKHHA